MTLSKCCSHWRFPTGPGVSEPAMPQVWLTKSPGSPCRSHPSGTEQPFHPWNFPPSPSHQRLGWAPQVCRGANSSQDWSADRGVGYGPKSRGRKKPSQPLIWTPVPGVVTKQVSPGWWPLEHVLTRHAAFSNPPLGPLRASFPPWPGTTSPEFLLHSWRWGVGPGLWEA